MSIAWTWETMNDLLAFGLGSGMSTPAIFMLRSFEPGGHAATQPTIEVSISVVGSRSSGECGVRGLEESETRRRQRALTLSVLGENLKVLEVSIADEARRRVVNRVDGVKVRDPPSYTSDELDLAVAAVVRTANFCRVVRDVVGVDVAVLD